MELVTRKSDCKRPADEGMFIKSPKEISRKVKENTPKYCIIVKPFHASFLPYRQIVFKGVTFSDDFSIELIRNADPVIIQQNHDAAESLIHADGNATFRLM
jgi:hypothetical protein